MSNKIYITNEEFEKNIDKALIIDVRTVQEYMVLQKISGSINVPFETFKSKKYIDELKQKYNKDTLIVTVCNAGNRSGMAADYLRENGFKNGFVLINGVYGWTKYKNSK